MTDLSPLLDVLKSQGISIFLVVWGVWFFSTRVWPWFAETGARTVDVLEKISLLLTVITENYTSNSDTHS
jgi:hypothetical protein